jgi:hypothetical protein
LSMVFLISFLKHSLLLQSSNTGISFLNCVQKLQC